MKKTGNGIYVLTDYDDPNEWRFEIQPEGLWPWTPYRLTLNAGLLRHGPGGWGWSCMTLGGARRKGERLLRRFQKKLIHKQERRARIAASIESHSL